MDGTNPHHSLHSHSRSQTSAEKAADVYQLTAECQALGSKLAKQFQTLSRLEAMHHTMAQAMAHETVLLGCVACSTAYRFATTIQNAEEWESTLCGHAEANKVWKDANDVIFSHLLRYDSKLVGFITSAEGSLLSHKLACMYNVEGPDDPSPSRAASPVLNYLAHSPIRSCSFFRTPSRETKMERSHSSSMSSTHSQEIKPTSLTGSGDEDSNGRPSTSQEGSETDEEDEASSNSEASRDGEGSDGRSSDGKGSSSGSEIAEEPSSEAEGSDTESSSSSSENDGEILTRVATPVKETKGGTLMKVTKGGNPNSSQMLSLLDLNSKDTVEEWKVQRHKDAQLLDKNFGELHDHMISKGHAKWNKCDTMICDHVDPCKEAKFLDPTGLPLDYMKHCEVFKSEKTNEYDLCRFYHVGLSGDLLNFPSPCKPATHELLSKFLLKARVLGCPNLVVVFVWDSASAICLLQELHVKDSLRHLLMEPKADAGGKAIKKLSIFLLYMYSGSNDISYMNHIMCEHYHANYRYRQCLNGVFTSRQQLKGHQKVCVGLPKEAKDHTSASPEKEQMSKDPSPNSQLSPSQSSQESSPASLHWCQCSKKKKSASTPKKADSTIKSRKSGKEESCKKVSKKSSQDKHCNEKMAKKEKHCDKDKADKGKSSKSSKK